MRHCCKSECERPAQYEIWWGPMPDDFTDSCLEHISDLMTDADKHFVYLIKGEKE